MTLRRATEADVAAIRQVTRAAYAKWVPMIGREPLPMTADYGRAVTEHIIELWEEAGELLALVELIPKPDHVLIENLAVRPDCQGRGLGKALLVHAEELARRLGFDEVRLYTNAVFTENLSFYARQGYVEFLRETMVPGSLTVHMKRTLGATGAAEGQGR